MKCEVQLTGVNGAKKLVVEVEKQGASYRISVDGRLMAADAVQVSGHTISILLDGQCFEIHVVPAPQGKLNLQMGAHEFTAEIQDPRALQGRNQRTLEAEGRQQIIAPMPGKVIRILVKAGDAVQAGQGMLVIEAMKMQNEIRSPKSGKVERLLASEGQNVSAGETLAWVE
jgi:biotin carboxyl carrier protein